MKQCTLEKLRKLPRRVSETTDRGNRRSATNLKTLRCFAKSNDGIDCVVHDRLLERGAVGVVSGSVISTKLEEASNGIEMIFCGEMVKRSPSFPIAMLQVRACSDNGIDSDRAVTEV
jgi:hypothetical protein